MTQQHRTILIIDGCLADRETYRQFLLNDQELKYTILETDSGAGGLALCQQQPIDGILLDLQLSDVDGLEFLSVLKQQTNGNCPPVVMLTGCGNERVAVKAIKSGVEDYLVKGKTTPDELRLSVRSAIANTQLRREMQRTEERFRISVENLLDCFGIYSAIRDESGTIVDFRIDYLNPAGLASNRMTQADIGKGLCELLPTHCESELFAEYCHVVETGKPLVKQSVFYTDVFGDERTTRVYDVRIAKLEDGFVASWRDITDNKQAEVQLRENQHLIQQIAETAPGIVYVYDLVLGRNVYVNRQVAELLGYSTEQVQAMGSELLPTLIHPDDWVRIPAHIEQFHRAADGDVFEIEYRMQHVDGEWRWFYGREVVFKKAADGSAQQILGIAQDITARKQAEIDLSRAHERFELAAAAVNCLIYDWDLGQNTVDRSPGLKEIVGYSPEEAGVTPQWWSDRIHPDDYPQIPPEDLISALITVDRSCLEYRVLHKDGCYRWVQDHAFVVKDADGQPIRIVGSTTDISDRKQAEATLRQSEALFRGIFDSDLIGILFWNIQGQITDANDTFIQMLDYSKEELRSGQIYYRDITPPEYHELDAEKFAILQTTGKFSPIEKEYIRKDGSRFPILVGCAFLPGYSDRGVAFVLDITERKQLEQERETLLGREQAARAEAETANSVKDQFLAILSHELRTPLNPILGWSKLLKSRNFDPATTTKALETIERNAQLQIQLIDDLLDVSRILRGKLTLNNQVVNLEYVIEAALETVSLAAEAKTITLKTQLDIDSCQVLGDVNRLQQVVSNLLSNAVKFTPAGGQVTVSLRIVEKQDAFAPPDSQLHAYAEIVVTDTGKGIAPEFLPHVFERFQQADSSITRQFGGLGLGLAIVRSLVELHGGTVTAASPGEGQGATFTVCLPTRSHQVTAQAGQVPEIDTNLQGMKILVVDDDPDTLELIAVVLREYQAVVTTATGATQALAVLEHQQLDLIISDIGMPDMDGYSLIRQIRTIFSAADIPAIALTAYARDEDRQQALAAGFQCHVAKPIDPLQLVAMCAKHTNLGIASRNKRHIS